MKGIFRLPEGVEGVLFGCFLNSLFSFAFPMMSLVIASADKNALAYLPWLMSFAYLISGVLQPKLGSMLDHGMTRKVVILSSILAAMGMVGLFIFEKHLALLVISLGALVLGISTISVVGSKLVEGNAKPNERGKASLMFSAALNLGFGFSALLAYFFLEQHRGKLLLLDGISILAYAAILLKSEKLHPSVVPLPPKVGSFRGQHCSFLSLSLGQKTVLAGVFCFFVAIVSSLSIVPLQYQIAGLDVHQFTPVMFAVNNVIVFTFSALLMNHIDQISLQTLALGSAGFLGTGLFLVPWVETQWQNVVVTIIWSVGEVIGYPVIAKSVFGSFLNSDRGKAAGYKGAMFRLALIVGPAFVGIVQSKSGYSFSFLFGLVPLLGCMFLWKQFVAEKPVVEAQS